MLTEDEQQHMLETLSITGEAQATARLAYHTAWMILDAGLTLYANRVRESGVPGLLAFAVWDFTLREAVAHHKAVLDGARDAQEMED